MTISINFDFDESMTDYVFFSNKRRYRNFSSKNRFKCIVTSNIPAIDVYLQVKYKDLLNDVDPVQDNAGLMLIKLLMNKGVKKIYIAGMDGYSTSTNENYYDYRMSFNTGKELAERKNAGMNSILAKYSKEVEIEFLTTPRFIDIKNC